MTISSTQSDFLNLSRWLAAWLVVAEHARSLMFQDFGASGAAGPLVKGFYFITGFGHEAVMIFFVISGYLVGGKVLHRLRAGTFRWMAYLCDRISRLYAVLLVALVLGWALDSAGARFFDDFGLYTNAMAEPVAVVNRNFAGDLGWREFFGNLLFLQTITVPTFGSNGPLWSLANEWWYYLLFPAVAGVALARGRVRWLGLLAATGMVFFLPRPILVLFVVWLMGVVASASGRRLLPWWCAAPACMAALVAARLEILPGDGIGRLLIGLGFALLLNSLVGSRRRWPMAGLSKDLAEFSYTTYLIHFPLLVFGLSAMHARLGTGLRLPVSATAFLLYGLVVAAVLSASWGLSLVTEARTAVYRDWLYRLARVSPHQR